jgi:hypothetical protein
MEVNQDILPEMRCINTTFKLLDLRPVPSSARTTSTDPWTTAQYQRYQLRPQLQQTFKTKLRQIKISSLAIMTSIDTIIDFGRGGYDTTDTPKPPKPSK